MIKNNIGLYFGSFNPIHCGHLLIASHVLNEMSLQEIWFVVSPQNPLKPSKTLLNEYQRLHLVRLATDDDVRMRASDIEFSMPKPSFTIDTLTYLQEKYPGNNFKIIMGSDSFKNIHKWKNYTELLKKFILIIYPRPGFLTEKTQENIHILSEAPLLNISATQIRKLIQQKKSIRYYVTEPVREEIEKAGYYK